MRMRYKPYARPELLACDYHAHVPLANKGRWASPFIWSWAAAKADFWPGWPWPTPRTTTWASTSPIRC